MLWRILPLSFFGLLLTYKVSRFYFQNIIFDEPILCVIASITLLVWLLTTRQDFKHFRLNRRRSQFIPTLIGCFFLVLNLAIAGFINYRMNAPTLIKGSAFRDFNGYSIDLKQNGRYVVGNYCLGASYIHGNYTLSENIITLDQGGIDNVIKTRKLKICHTAQSGYEP